MMPVMSGYDVLEEAKNDPALRHVSFLVLSAATRDKIEELVESTGAHGYLTKPVQLSSLIDAVKRLS